MQVSHSTLKVALDRRAALRHRLNKKKESLQRNEVKRLQRNHTARSTPHRHVTPRRHGTPRRHRTPRRSTKRYRTTGRHSQATPRDKPKGDFARSCSPQPRRHQQHLAVLKELHFYSSPDKTAPRLMMQTSPYFERPYQSEQRIVRRPGNRGKGSPVHDSTELVRRLQNARRRLESELRKAPRPHMTSARGSSNNRSSRHEQCFVSSPSRSKKGTVKRLASVKPLRKSRWDQQPSSKRGAVCSSTTSTSSRKSSASTAASTTVRAPALANSLTNSATAQASAVEQPPPGTAVQLLSNLLSTAITYCGGRLKDQTLARRSKIPVLRKKPQFPPPALEISPRRKLDYKRVAVSATASEAAEEADDACNSPLPSPCPSPLHDYDESDSCASDSAYLTPDSDFYFSCDGQ